MTTMHSAPQESTLSQAVAGEPVRTTQPEAPKQSPRRVWALLGVVVVASAASVAALREDQEEEVVEAADVPRIQDGRIVFSQAFRDRIQLTTEKVRAAPLTPVVSTVGMITFDPRHVARVGTRLRGVVRALHVYEGAEVERGQVLAEINSPELGEAQAQVAMLEAQASAAARQAEREEALREKSLSTAKEAEEASAERSRYESMLSAARQRVAALSGGSVGRNHALGVHTLTAPIAGTLVERHITQGELVDGDRTAFLIAQLDHLWVELDVFERSLSAVRVGDEVDLTPLSDPNTTIKGRVAQVGAVLDPGTRSAPVRVEIDNRERLLRPGQAVDALIKASGAATKSALVVPTEAITYVDGEPTVFVATGPLSVAPTVVELGEDNGRERQVLKGLELGQEVVVQGVFELKSELFR